MVDQLITTLMPKGARVLLGVLFFVLMGCTERDLKVSFFKSLDTSVTVQISAPTQEIGVWKDLPVTLEFSEPISDFEKLELQVLRGTVTHRLPDSAHPGRIFHLKIQSDLLMDERAEVSIVVPQQQIDVAALDIAGVPQVKELRRALTKTPLYRQKNVVRLSTTAGEFVNGQFPVQVEFDREVVGFGSSSIVVENGTIANFSGAAKSYSFVVQPATDGEVKVYISDAVVFDVLENSNQASNVLSTLYDNTAPVITVIAQETGAWLKSQRWTWSCTEECTFIYQITNSATSTLDASGNFSTVSSIEKSTGTGLFYLHVMAKDRAGNIATAVESAQLDNTVPDAPVITVTKAFHNSTSATPYLSIVTGGVDHNSGLAGYEARVRLGEQDLTGWMPYTGGVFNFYSSNIFTPLQDNKNYEVQVRAVDNVGNFSTPASGHWMTDFSAPLKPTGLAVGEVPFILDRTPILTWPNTTDIGSGVDKYEVKVTYSDGSEKVPWMVAHSGEPLSVTLSDDIDYRVYLRAIDLVGNISEESDFATWKARECPVNYLRVTPVTGYTTKEFCISKYEMSLDGGSNAVSVPALPAISIKQTEAITKCRSLSSSHDLISNAQWQAVARTIELNPLNWLGGAIGTGGVPRGYSSSHGTRVAASVDDDLGCYSAGSAVACASSDPEQRTLHLGDKIIWDFAGNVWEWVRDGYASLGLPTGLTVGITYDWSTINTTLSTANANKYKQNFYTSNGDISFGKVVAGNSGAVARGGDYGGGAESGIYAANLNNSISVASAFIGFRCVIESDPR